MTAPREYADLRWIGRDAKGRERSGALLVALRDYDANRRAWLQRAYSKAVAAGIDVATVWCAGVVWGGEPAQEAAR